jgi:glycine oxidase
MAVRMVSGRSVETHGCYNTRMARHPDVLVIGGGVIGLTTAYFLAREGATVRLLDRSTPGSEASWAGAGIIPPGNPAGARSPYDRLRAESSAAFPAFSAELRERTGIDNGYRRCGGIEVFQPSEPLTTAAWQAEGIPFEPILAQDLERIEPALRLPPSTVFHLPGMAQVRNPWHLRALLAACRGAGVDIRPSTALATFHTTAGRVRAAVTDAGELHTADCFLVASGAWTDGVLESLGVRTSIHPVLGQMVLFRSSKPLLQRIICVGKRYLVPRDDGRILAGSTEEPEAGFDKRTTVEGCDGLIRFAMELLPALSRAEVETTWAGLRPGTMDDLPYMGPVPGYENTFVAAGHFRSGIQLSLATARVMTQLLTGTPPSIPLSDLRLDRPTAGPIPRAFRS